MMHKCIIQAQFGVPEVCNLTSHKCDTTQYSPRWKVIETTQGKKEDEYGDLEECQKLLWSVLCG